MRDVLIKNVVDGAAVFGGLVGKVQKRMDFVMAQVQRTAVAYEERRMEVRFRFIFKVTLGTHQAKISE